MCWCGCVFDKWLFVCIWLWFGCVCVCLVFVFVQCLVVLWFVCCVFCLLFGVVGCLVGWCCGGSSYVDYLCNAVLFGWGVV